MHRAGHSHQVTNPRRLAKSNHIATRIASEEWHPRHRHMVISFRLVVGQLTLKFEPVLINLTDCSQHNHIPHFGSIRLENPGVFLPGFLMLFVGHLGQIEYYSNLFRRLADQFGTDPQTGNI